VLTSDCSEGAQRRRFRVLVAGTALALGAGTAATVHSTATYEAPTVEYTELIPVTQPCPEQHVMGYPQVIPPHCPRPRDQ
jgi:hypothetical protein